MKLPSIFASIGALCALIAAAEAQESKLLTLNEFKVDKLELKGKPVAVAGQIVPIGEFAAMGNDANDSNPVFVDPKNLSRDQKLRLQDCPRTCAVIVKGVVGSVMFDTGVLASDIKFK